MLPLLTILFFGSGACALIYQVMWLRLLALVFGVTVYAASTVLAGFMAGLAVGSFVAGRVASRLTRPLAVFGVVEALVGVTALASPEVLAAITRLWVSTHPLLPESTIAVTAIRFIVAFLVLIVPTSLMGATLPLVVKSAVIRDERIGGRIGWLYAVNTTGAIVGALTAGFYLISEIGVTQSFRYAAATNVLIGIVAVVASYVLPRPERSTSTLGTSSTSTLGTSTLGPPSLAPNISASFGAAGTVGTNPGTTGTLGTFGTSSAPGTLGTLGTPGTNPGTLGTLGTLGTFGTLTPDRAILWTFFLSGVMSLALEVIWFRMLVVFLRPTAYAFTIMLAAVLAGIALGSALAAPFLRLRLKWMPVLTIVQALIGLTAVLSFGVLAKSQDALDLAAPWIAWTGINTYLGPLIVSSLIAMLPTTLLFGVAFPVGLSLWAGGDGREDTSRRVGTFYSLNVLGAIVGSVVSGFVLLPWIGTRPSLIAVSALAVVSSVMLAFAQRRERPTFARTIAVLGPIVFAVAAVNSVDPFDIAMARFHRRETLVWRQEGVQTTVAVHDRPDTRRPMRVMYLDGNHQSNDSDGTAFVHHRIGALPVMLHQRPTTALVIGLGGGATPGAVAAFGVDVDVVELSQAVVDGSNFFTHINYDLLKRPNVHLRVDDGRNFLLMTRKKYDVITADIILPRHAGAGSLYSKEYYELVRNALAPGGLVMQWNGGETETEYKLMMRTFLSVFPYTSLWGDGSLMLGSMKPFELSWSAYEARRQMPEFTQVFNWDERSLRRNYVAGPDAVRAFVGDGPVLTDDKPVIEYFLSLPKDERPVDRSLLKGTLDEVLRP